jgi:transcriptional regulator with XRE-family HTH domain
MEDNVATRLKLFIDTKCLTSSQFADKCGIPRPTLSQLLTGRNKKISDVLIGQIHQAYPDLSILWLMFGEGNMLSTDLISAPDLLEDDLFMQSDTLQMENPNLMALNDEKNILPNRMNKEKSGTNSLPGNFEQINQNTISPRKVVQITVYYDDSTFETFYPNK